ncbi:MAG: class III poly(R)-hydroxyalkanoic acid synthase subunit PhaC [Acidobacteria bacterium]|nr:MAG: class III poly(R)-hydroxyalkanoic acid synthase subunit PhaC [Acidobacteriota bacterium]
MEAYGYPERANTECSSEHWEAASPARMALDLFVEQQRIWRNMLSFPRVVELASKTRVGASAHDVVFGKRMIRLLRYRRETSAAYSEPVLFCYALINRPYILDLQPDKSLIRRYLERGFDVYMIDWGIPSDADKGLTLDDYVCEFLMEIVQFILREHGREDLHLLGYCMGGTMAALFTALHPDRVTSLTLLAAPIDFGGKESLLNCWTEQRYFDVDALIDTYGNCPAWFLQSCFLYMKPIQNLFEKYIAFYEQMDDSQMISNYFAMERWVNDNVPVAGETFRVFVKNLYQANELVLGGFRIDGKRADLAQITCPLLLLTAKNDHLVSPRSTEGIRPHVKSQEIKSMMIEAGHVGLVVGSKAQRTFWPEATQWLADHSTNRQLEARRNNG